MDLWHTEHQFWTAGAEFFAQAVAPGCVMVFPEPAGILQGEAIVEALRAAPRWASIAISDRHLAQLDHDTVVVAYRAQADRDARPPYAALCSSTYHRIGGRWLLIQHQQTPV